MYGFAPAKKWVEPRQSQVPLLRLRPPSCFCARRARPGRPARTGDEAVRRTQLATQRGAGDRCCPHDGCAVDKKKGRRKPLSRKPLSRKPLSRKLVNRKLVNRKRRYWNWTRCGRLWASANARSGCGWPSNGPRGALWVGCWAAGARPRGDGFFRACRFVTNAIPRTIPMRGKRTPRCYPPPPTGPAPKAAARPASSKRSIVRSATAAGYWFENRVRSANP